MIDSTLGTIYEDVADLQERVASLEALMATAQSGISDLNTDISGLQSDITALKPQILAEGTDLDTLGLGSYIIPSASVCATLSNKPISNNATGFLKVISGGNEGQMTMYYIPCTKDTPSYYQRAYYQNSWGNWNTVNLVDSGWLDLTLVNGATAYSESQKPRYRQIGKEIFLNGVFKGITESNITIATLPSGFRPSKKTIVAVASVGQMISRLTIDTDGTITYNRSTIEPITNENYHSIACTFCVS